MKETYRILPKIRSPRDVKRLKECCLTTLSAEIRRAIVDTVSKNGGHLASNLGMVETTLALHRVFDLPKDSVIFDVSHQAYAHKLLTGRYPEFGTLRQIGGLSGFTNRSESEYDTVTAGHSGSAISTAIGIAEANRLKNNGAWTVAVVGDGSFTNGMVYEALNQLASKNLRLIVILNDNEMSISKNVGGLTEYLAYIRTSSWYFDLKYYSKLMMERLPVIGSGLVNTARNARDIVKRLTNSETWFESFGLEYIGPADGNDIGQMINVLAEAKKKNCPVVVHIRTVKGLGFAPSEEHPEKFHSIGAFSPEQYLVEPAIGNAKSPSSTFTSEVGRILTEEGEKNKKLCAITAAMTEGCGLGGFAEKFPERFFDVGIAEEHAVTMAGGLSIGGMIPVTVLYSTFAQRVFDQMWHDVALQDTKAVFLFSHAGLVGGDGITHQGIYDAALFSRIKGVRIYSPDNFRSFGKAFGQAMNDRGISIVRYPKGSEAVYPDCVKFTESDGSKKYAVIGSGSRNFLVITYSRITEDAVNAAMTLSGEYPDCRFTVCSLNRIVPLPLDDELIGMIHSADRLLFVEEHIRSGGIGEALASDSRIRRSIPIHAIEDPSVPCGDLKSIRKLCRMDADSLAARMREELERAVKFRVEIE